MKCIFINLADQQQRWESMAAQLAGWPFPAVRFEAVNGAALSLAQTSELYSPELNRRIYHQPLKPGEIGCYASHIAVWRGLLEGTDPEIAVFEDDVTLHADLPKLLAAVPAVEGVWEMIKLTGRRHELAIESRPWIAGHQLIRYRRLPSFCSAYVINREGARRMLAAHVPFGRPVDIDLRHWWESGCRIVGVQPYPVSLSTLSRRSTIGSRATPWVLSAKLRRLFLQAAYIVNNERANRGPAFVAGPKKNDPLDRAWAESGGPAA